MTRTVSAAVDPPSDPIVLANTPFRHGLSGGRRRVRTGILWMLAATCLFVCQDSTSRILLRSYPATEIAFARYLVHMVLVTLVLAWRDPRLMISRRPILQILRSGFLLGATLFAMLR